MEIALLEMCKMECEQIILELNSGLIFPHVKYVITFEREPNPETHGDTMVCLTLRGCKLKDTCFSIPVREGKFMYIYVSSHCFIFCYWCDI